MFLSIKLFTILITPTLLEWTALNGTDGLTHKQIKKATKLIDKDFFLGLGWLLREDKVSTSEVEGELFVKLN